MPKKIQYGRVGAPNGVSQYYVGVPTTFDLPTPPFTFTPADLSHQPELWLKPDGFTSTLGDNPPVPINSWTNAGTAGQYFSGTTTGRPTKAFINTNVLCADFDGVNDIMTSSLQLGAVISTGSYHFFAVVDLDAVNTDADNIGSSLFNNDAIFADANSTFGISFRSSGSASLVAYHYDGVDYMGASASFVPIGISASTLVEVWYDNVNIHARCGNGTIATKAAGVVNAVNGILQIGKDGGGSTWFDGRLAEPMCFKVMLSGADVTNIRQYYANTYGVTI